jgi:hypothetical protein
VEDGGEGMTPSYEELERALASVPGIVAASVAVSESTGRGRLRLRLAPGEDPDAVSWAVAATLRERFGISLDPDTIRPRLDPDDVSGPPAPPPEPGVTAEEGEGLAPDDEAPIAEHESPAEGDEAPADEDLAPTADEAIAAPLAAAVASSGGRGTRIDERAEVASADAAADAGPAPAGVVVAVAPGDEAGAEEARVRAAIRDLVTRHREGDVEVTATLEVAGREGRAEASGVLTRRGVWRAVAEATLGALRELTGDHLRAGVDRISVHREDPDVVTVLVSVRSERGEETLLGASLVRDDPEAAVMRATLDALNRRVEPWLRAAN